MFHPFLNKKIGDILHVMTRVRSSTRRKVNPSEISNDAVPQGAQHAQRTSEGSETGGLTSDGGKLCLEFTCSEKDCRTCVANPALIHAARIIGGTPLCPHYFDVKTFCRSQGGEPPLPLFCRYVVGKIHKGHGGTGSSVGVRGGI